jgi:mannose-6-phosphate isomerase
MNRLYPLKFRPIIKEKIWGGTRLKTVLHKKSKAEKAGESWEISCFPGSISRVRNGFLTGNTLEELIEVYMGDLVGDGVFEKYGTLFPLLVKFIDANEALSIQVHPNDDLARKQFGSYGKTEMWYVIEAEKDAEIIVGFDKQVDRRIWQQHLRDKTIMDLLHKEKAGPGDMFFLPSGRIHAIGAGILLAEIQQTSDATLRVYDYDRTDAQGNLRELHTEKALEAIDFNVYKSYRTSYEKQKDVPNRLAACEYFTVNLLELEHDLIVDYSTIDSFVIYICLDGKLKIRYYDNDQETLEKGETILVPAEIRNLTLLPEKSSKILEVYIEGLSALDLTDELLNQMF